MSEPNPAPEGESHEAQLARYQSWATQLEGNIEDMARQRRWYWLYLGAGALVGGVGWQFQHFFGGAAFALGLILWSTGLYITYMRTWYYKNELARTRVEIERLLET
jgi:hypothetical protein